jgi:hypothetical protein
VLASISVLRDMGLMSENVKRDKNGSGHVSRLHVFTPQSNSIW